MREKIIREREKQSIIPSAHTCNNPNDHYEHCCNINGHAKENIGSSIPRSTNRSNPKIRTF
jgi:hypothetical protein